MKDYPNNFTELDLKDSLANYKNHFVNDDDIIYLDGNSLGKLPKKTVDLLSGLIENQWGKSLIRSWNESWIDLSSKIAEKIAQIVGAEKDEIFIGDSTSLNLYKLAYAILTATPNKNKIISDDLNFPSDLYVFQGLIEKHFKEHTLSLVKSNDGISVDDNQIEEVIDDKTALVSLSHVTYKSSFMYDMKRINDMAHKKNSFVLWDLSHAVGSVNIELNKTNADLAVGCTYKYLNGGPGAPAFIYVKRELQEKLENPITSWFSHEKPFDFESNYKAISTIQKFAVGTPSILSLAAIEPGLDIILDAGMKNIREKSVDQTNFLIGLISKELLPIGFTIASPMDYRKRGSHVSVQHPEAYRINRAMIEPENNSKFIIPDFRPPNNLRLGVNPVYTSFEELSYSIERIKEIVINKEYVRFDKEKLKVI